MSMRYLRRTWQGKKKSKEGYEGEDHVGIDEEDQYLDGGEQENGGEQAKDADHKATEDVTQDVEEDSDEQEEDSDDHEEDSDEGAVSDEDSDGAIVYDIPAISYDKDNPPMTKGTLFPSIEEFRVALAIVNEFSYKIDKSDQMRVRVSCSYESPEGKNPCKWRVNGSTLYDGKTVMVKNEPKMHTCPSTQRDGKVKVAKRKWIAARVTDWLKGDPSMTSIALKKRLFEKYHVDIDYQRVLAGRRIALDQIFGKWEDSFECLHNWQAGVLRKCPTSIVVINHKEIEGQQRFTRAFVCFRACIDGFLSGCRPYLSVDATALNGKWKGQLAVACGVDGHNWLYPVAYAVFDSETKENWDYFMENLKSAIGTPEGLVICTDACKGLETAVHRVFPTAEHRECFRHMIMNFRKKFHGKVFEENLWPTAYTYSPAKHNHHMKKIMEANPEAIAYLDEWHSNLWIRSKFSTTCKCDYVMNNIAESFNSMIKKLKGFPVLELLDSLREWLMVRFEIRAKIARRFVRGLLKILPRITNMMNNRSRGVVLDGISRSDDCKAEVTIKIHGYNWKHCVDLEKWECSCRRWQVTGQPCLHASRYL